MPDGAYHSPFLTADDAGAMLRAHGARQVGITLKANGQLVVFFSHRGKMQAWVLNRKARIANFGRDLLRELGPVAGMTSR